MRGLLRRVHVVVGDADPPRVSGEGYEECGCCQAGEYAGDETADDVSCPECGHSPEEHSMMVIYPSQRAVLDAVDRFLAQPDMGVIRQRRAS